MGNLSLQEQFSFSIFSYQLKSVLKNKEEVFRFPTASKAVYLLRVTDENGPAKAELIFDTCDPMGNRTPIYAVRGRCPNR